MFNFRSGTALAVQQDQYIAAILGGNILSEAQVRDLENNLWVSTAAKMSPCNLVIRQYALIDLSRGNAGYGDKILNQMSLLSYRNPDKFCIWAEGYSYFQYTMAILRPWMVKYAATINPQIKSIVDRVREGFIATSYIRNGVKYPAPLGDVRDEPLRPEDQIELLPINMTISNMTYTLEGDQIRYNIKGRPIGFNTHIPKDDSVVIVKNGIPQGFHFYEGYDKKYKNSWAEYLDTFSIKRLRSIP